MSGYGFGGVLLLVLGPGLAFGVVGAVLATIGRVRWFVGLPATFAALVVFALWFSWNAARGTPSTAGDIARGTLMVSLLATLPLVAAYLLAAAASRGLGWLLRKP